jgi:aminodeoxyfutalosine deaminase
MKGIRARRIMTMAKGDSCLDDGLLIAGEQGVVLAVGPYRTLSREHSCPVEDLGPVTIVPGLLNAHSHLELCGMHGRTTLGQGFESWVRSLIALPQDIEPFHLSQGAAQLRECGVVHSAEVTSRAPLQVAQALEEHGVGTTLLVEFIGFRHGQEPHLRWPARLFETVPQKLVCAAGHALYSTHPGTLQKAKAWDSQNNRTFAVHLAEHAGELEFLATGRGSFGELLMERGLVPRSFVPPGLSPVAYADRLGLLDDCTLAVHCVHLTDEDIDTLARTETSVCLCPRSNSLIGVGRTPWEKMLRADITLCLGTDSLASNEDLNLWHEAVHLLRAARTPVSLSDLLLMLTVNPAKALRLQNLGSLEPGKSARYAVLPRELEDLRP